MPGGSVEPGREWLRHRTGPLPATLGGLRHSRLALDALRLALRRGSIRRRCPPPSTDPATASPAARRRAAGSAAAVNSRAPAHHRAVGPVGPATRVLLRRTRGAATPYRSVRRGERRPRGSAHAPPRPCAARVLCRALRRSRDPARDDRPRRAG
ncbi:hypothetical protein PV367_47840, partial [Streptomyces europaeiscabiei]|nr:hypothetical protein [Streptomyces europaeiscabiei]